MLRVKILGADGSYVTRDEIVSLYASDMDYVPYIRKASIDYDATINLEVPQGPVILHAKLRVPGYGYGMWIMSDNCGAGYGPDAEVDFIHDATESRIHEVEVVLGTQEFDPSPKCLAMLRDAKSLLTLAGANPVKAPAYHMLALAAAMWSGELAVVERAQARIRKTGRRDDILFGAGGFSYPYTGAREWNGRGGKCIDYKGMPSMKENFDSVFNYATLPFYLANLEPEYGKPDFSYLDYLQDEFEKAGITTKGHPLWWAHTAGMPAWTKGLKWEDGSIKREIDRTISRTVKRYKGRIHYYDAINENHDWCNSYNLTQDQQTMMTKYCCDAMHEADPDVHAVVNTCFMFGENAADGRTQWGPTWERNLVPYTAIERLEELGTQYEAIGMQLYNPARDMLAIDKMYDRFKKFGRRVHLTELGVPSFEKDVRPNTTPGDIYCLKYMYYGLWHEMGWNERLQADWVEQFYTVTYSHPEVEAITMWSMADPGYVPASGLFTEDFEPKESFFRLKELEKSWGFDFGKK